MDPPHPMFGLDVQTDDPPTPSRGYDKVYYLLTWGLWGEQGRPPKQVWKCLREQGKETGMVFDCG